MGLRSCGFYVTINIICFLAGCHEAVTWINLILLGSAVCFFMPSVESCRRMHSVFSLSVCPCATRPTLVKNHLLKVDLSGEGTPVDALL